MFPMGKKTATSEDEMFVPDTPRSSKNRKQLAALDVTPRSVDSSRERDVSPRSVGKSPRSIGKTSSNVKLDFSGSAPGKGGGGGSPKNGENGDGDPEYVNADITADELRQIEQVLRTSEPRLQELYKKVRHRPVKPSPLFFAMSPLDCPPMHNI